MPYFTITGSRMIKEHYITHIEAKDTQSAVERFKQGDAICIRTEQPEELDVETIEIDNNGIPHVKAYVTLQRVDEFTSNIIDMQDVEFDCTYALEMLIDEANNAEPRLNDELFISTYLNIDDENAPTYNFNDQLFYNAVKLNLVNDWDGPFECHISYEDDGWYEYRKYKADQLGYTTLENDEIVP